MNIKKGFIRVFILLSCGAMVVGGIVGYEYSIEKLRPTPREAFQLHEWNELNSNRYFSIAEAFSRGNEKIKRFKILNQDRKKQGKEHLQEEMIKNPFLGLSTAQQEMTRKYENKEEKEYQELLVSYVYGGKYDIRSYESVDKDQLARYKSTPPEFNLYVFREAFPSALKTPLEIVIIATSVGAISAYLLTFVLLRFVMAIAIWIYSGFAGKA